MQRAVKHLQGHTSCSIRLLCVALTDIVDAVGLVCSLNVAAPAVVLHVVHHTARQA
jgi:hypothetical protein